MTTLVSRNSPSPISPQSRPLPDILAAERRLRILAGAVDVHHAALQAFGNCMGITGRLHASSKAVVGIVRNCDRVLDVLVADDTENGPKISSRAIILLVAARASLLRPYRSSTSAESAYAGAFGASMALAKFAFIPSKARCTPTLAVSQGKTTILQWPIASIA